MFLKQMDITRINQMVHDDRLPTNLDRQYTHSHVVNRYHNEVKTTYSTPPVLLANRITFRLAQEAPPNELPDYCPSYIGDHPALIQFIDGLFQHELSNTTVEVNFSPSFICVSANQASYLYSSQNFLAFPVAHTIHNNATKTAFLDRLRSFSLADYISCAMRNLSTKYDDVILTPISLHFYIRRRPDIVYGKLFSKAHQNDKNSCFWNSLSQNFRLQNHELKPVSPPKKRPNLQTAIWMKKQFIHHIKYVKKGQLHHFMNKNGVTEKGINVAEQLFSINIDFWSNQFTNVTKIWQNKVTKLDKKQKFHLQFRKSNQKFRHTANLYAEQTEKSGIRHLTNINNPNFFSKKFFCETCKMRFNKPCLLKRHQKSKVHSRSRFIQNSPMQQKVHGKQLLRTMVPKLKSLKVEKSYAYITISTTTTKGYSVQIHYRTNTMGQHCCSFTDKSLHKCADYCFSVITKISYPVKIANFLKNATFLAKFDKISKDWEESKQTTRKTNHNNQYFGLFERLKQYIIAQISLTPCFITTTEDEQSLGSTFLLEILKIGLKTGSNIDLTTKLGHPKCVTAKGPNSNVQFLNLINVSTGLCMNSNQTLIQNSDEFNQLNQKLFIDFGYDLIYDRVQSITEFANLYFQNQLHFGAKFGLISPSHTLQSHIQNSVRFGHLHGIPNIVHPNSHFKSFMNLDFSKFYGTILKRMQPFLGRSVQFDSDGLLFKPKNKLNHYVFANVLFSTIQTMIQNHLHFKLFGNECAVKIGSKSHNVDCVMSSFDKSQPKKSVVEFQGCFFHSCQMDQPEQGGQCHLPPKLQNPNHPKSCPICIAAKSPASKFRPSLWRLKNHETPQSLHPTIQKPHQEIAEETTRIETGLKSSTEFDQLIAIRECQVVQFWQLPIIKFLDHFGFKPKPTAPVHQTLGSVFEKTLTKYYPIYDSSKKVTTQRVINLIKAKQVFGLVVVSGKAGQKSKQILKGFEPFSSISDGKMINSFELQTQLITTDFCAYLLNNETLGSLPDFILHKIHQIFVYPTYRGLPYEPACNFISDLIQNNKNDPKYLSILKSIPNFYIGNFGFNPNSSPKCIVLTNMDLFGLPQTKNFLKCEHLVNDHYLAHFSQHRMFKNVCHNNLAVIQYGRMSLIQLVVMLTKFLHCEVVRSNTDGITVVSTLPFPPPKLLNPSPILFLDHWLRSNLTQNDLINYVRFKNQYFESPLICSDHESEYIESLLNKTDFTPRPCCIDYKSINGDLKLKIEQFGHYCIVTGKNQMCSWDYFTRTAHVKCSGLKERTVTNFFNFTNHDLASLQSEIIPS